jgi:hypothetical protein
MYAAAAPHFHNRTRLPAELCNPLVFCFADALGVHDLFLKHSLSEFDGSFRVRCQLRIARGGVLCTLSPRSVAL